jgi:hypothetical protein
MLAAVVAASPVSADEPVRLARLHRMSLAVEIVYPLPGLAAADLGARVARALRGATPPLTIEHGLSDRLRVRVAVRPVNATTLRGFWLPFSGTYGVGSVRLAVERAVTSSGAAHAFPATVWQTDRIVGAAWGQTDREVGRLVDEMVEEFVEARRVVTPSP